MANGFGGWCSQGAQRERRPSPATDDQHEDPRHQHEARAAPRRPIGRVAEQDVRAATRRRARRKAHDQADEDAPCRCRQQESARAKSSATGEPRQRQRAVSTCVGSPSTTDFEGAAPHRQRAGVRSGRSRGRQPPSRRLVGQRRRPPGSTCRGIVGQHRVAAVRPLDAGRTCGPAKFRRDRGAQFAV